jgi:predicted nucleic acid-binding protein
VYVDTSVVLAQLFAEDRLPPAALWANPLITSRLLAYETWTRVHARSLSRAHGEKVRLLLGRLAFVELHPQALARALEPFPVPVRTLDALHLASIEFLRSNGQVVELATYDDRLRGAARAMGVPLFDL